MIMATEDTKFAKTYYSVGEVAEILGESTSLVRFWAERFPRYIKPARNKKGNRLFSPDDMANFKVIYYLVRERGMTLDGAEKMMKDNKKGVDNTVEIVDRLKGIKECLVEIQKKL